MTAIGRAQHRPIKERPVILGEVLFDTFPDGSSVLGGAPFNVAWHLQGFGLNPLFISRVGNDSRGKQVQESMTDWGMDTAGVQLDPHYPTGLVEIALSNGQPDFTILPEQSYDHIEQHIAERLISATTIPLLYFGTLISRSAGSAQTLENIKSRSDKTFVDVNLRKECWTFDSVDRALKNATWAKLNDEELGVIAVHKHIPDADIAQCAQAVKDQYSVSHLIITQGADGAFIACGSQIIKTEPVKVGALVDAVGAGDAFSSVVMLGVLKQWSLANILERAVQFSAEICAIRGATTNNQELYKKYINHWGMNDCI